MKIWFERSYSYKTDEVTVGLYWYRHAKDHPWKGVSIQFMFLKWMLSGHWVNDFALYTAFFERRAEKRKVWREKKEFLRKPAHE